MLGIPYIEHIGVQFELRDPNAASGPRLLQAKILNHWAPTAGRWCRPAGGYVFKRRLP